MILGYQECLVPHPKFFNETIDMRVVLAEIERFSFTEHVLLGRGDVVDSLYLLQDDKCSRDAMLSNPDRIIAISADLMLEFVLVQWTRKSLRTIDGL